MLCASAVASAQQRDSTNIERALLHNSRAGQALRNRDFVKYFEEVKAVNAELPFHTALTYYVARAAFLNNRDSEGIQHLNTLAGFGAHFDLATDTIFARKLSDPELSSVARRLKENMKPVVSSRRAAEVPELDLAAEGVAYDPKSGALFVSSIHKRKIVRIDKKGVITDLSKPADSLLGVYGMYSDGKYLWACNIAVPQCIGFDRITDKRSFLAVYDLASGNLAEKIYTGSPTSQIKDVTIGNDGAVLFTDMASNHVYRYKKGGSPELFVSGGALGNALGLAWSERGNSLFVSDHLQGIFKFDHSGNRIAMVKPIEGTTLQGIDGLYCSGRTLIGIQNGRGFSRVVMCTLNEAMDQVTAMKVIDSFHPDHDWPTLGATDGRTFYYVANSQWNNFTAKATVVAPDKSKPTYILSAPLR